MAYHRAKSLKDLQQQLGRISGAGNREIARKKIALVAAFAVRASKKHTLAAEIDAYSNKAGIAPRANSSPALVLVRATLPGPGSSQTRLAQLVDRAVSRCSSSEAAYQFIVDQGQGTRFRRKIRRDLAR